MTHLLEQFVFIIQQLHYSFIPSNTRVRKWRIERLLREEMVEIDHEGSHKRGGRNVKKGRRIKRVGDFWARKW